MAQSKWERAFWAVARSDGFKPYPPSHYKKKKTGSKKRHRKPRKGEQLSFGLF